MAARSLATVKPEVGAWVSHMGVGIGDDLTSVKNQFSSKLLIGYLSEVKDYFDLFSIPEDGGPATNHPGSRRFPHGRGWSSVI